MGQLLGCAQQSICGVGNGVGLRSLPCCKQAADKSHYQNLPLSQNQELCASAPQAMFWEGFQRGGGCCTALDLQAVPGRDRGSSHTFTGRTSLAPFGGDNPQNCVLHQNYKGNENRKLKHTRLICLPPISCFPSGVMNTHLQ